MGFTQNDMALMLGVSKRTVENRFAEFNLTRIERFSDIDDGSLDVYTKRIIAHFPRSGTVSDLSLDFAVHRTPVRKASRCLSGVKILILFRDEDYRRRACVTRNQGSKKKNTRFDQESRSGWEETKNN